MSLTSLLPAPKHAHSLDDPFKSNRYAGRSLALAPVPPPVHAITGGGPVHEPPPYGFRKGFTPKSIGDFGDGGAFPEIHQLQYPLDMGRKENIISQQKVTPLTVDDKGNIKYDMLVRQHARKDQHVYASYKDLVPKMVEDEELEKPSAEEALKQAERTRAALGLLVDASIATAQPKTVKQKKEPVFVRYTPSNQGESYNSGAQQRIIKVSEKPVDPLEPPQFRHKKLPGGPPSPPAPIMHSPPRKITVQDQQNWKIPPCVSNWKNIKGYVIPLDKRLAADGRGLQEAQINDKFAKLSESLFLAERTARKEIEMRADMIRRLQRQQEEVKEQELRNLAARARQAGQAKQQEEPAREEEAFDEATKETEEDVEARAAREELRKERKRELKRDLRMENMKEDKRGKTRSAREGERDVSEKIALGQAVPTSKDGLMDQRLFNQDQGLESGFGAEDDYNVYDKQLFKGSSANFIYRPKPSEDMAEADVAKLIEKSAGKFKPDRGFKGADKAPSATTARDKPVEFEKDEVDPFNLNVLLTDAHKAPSKHTSLDKIGKTGHMSAAVSGSKDDYSNSRQRTMQFEEGSSGDDRGKRRKH